MAQLRVCSWALQSNQQALKSGVRAGGGRRERAKMEEEERGAGRKKRERGILKKAQAYWVLGTERGR